eukprot:COSAG02_NODE_147_length_33939_cov_6.689539_30_plen_148_part_00
MGEPLQAQSGPFRRSGAESSVARRPISFFEGLRRLSDLHPLIRFIDERANAVTAAFRWLWAQSLIGHAVSGSLWRVDLSCPRRFSATRVGYLDLSSLLYRNQPSSLLVQSPHLHLRVRFVHNDVSVRLISLSFACVAYLQQICSFYL